MSDMTPKDQERDMAPEYDFSRGKRGKHASAFLRGYTIVVRSSDGSEETRTVTFPEGVVALDPDVRAYFPDSESVNDALRSLIELMKHLPKGQRYRRQDPSTRQVAE